MVLAITRHSAESTETSLYSPSKTPPNSQLWLIQLQILDHELDSDTLCPDDRSEEHRLELQSLMRISYVVFCLIININIRLPGNPCSHNNIRRTPLRPHPHTYYPDPTYPRSNV